MVNGLEMNQFAKVIEYQSHILHIIYNYIYLALIIDCGNLRDPRNGNVDLTGTTVGSQAIYSCDIDFILQGNIVRKCQNNAEWSGKEPICIRMSL